MSRARSTHGVAGVIFRDSWRAAPGLTMTLLGLSTLVGIASGLSPYGIKLFLDGVTAGSHRDLAVAVGVMVGTLTVSTVSAQLGTALGQRLSWRVDVHLSARLGQLTSGIAEIEHLERPDYRRELDLLTNGKQVLGQASLVTLGLLQAVLRLGLTVALLLTISPSLLLLLVAGVAPFAATRRAVRVRIRAAEASAEDHRLRDQLFWLASSAASARELRVYRAAPELERRYDDLVAATTRRTAVAERRALLLMATGWSAYSAYFVLAITHVAIMAVHGDVSIGTVGLVISIGRTTTMQVSQFADSVAHVSAMVTVAKRYVWLESYAAASSPPRATEPVPERLAGGIVFEDVSFRYPGTTRDVLSHVDLVLPAGATVALVGENGSGKSTLLKLLCGMYRPTSGRILVDGVELDRLGAEAWRARCSAVFQDYVHYEFLLSEGVGVGDLGKIDDLDAVQDALERADAGTLADSLPLGLATPLGRSFRRGHELSVGQWQKVAVGRSLLRSEPVLLLLDEPTSSLDPASEAALHERFRVAAATATARTAAAIVLVSHRFTTVRMADRIVVLADGTVVESGPHDELVRSEGLYAELYEMQARGYRDRVASDITS